MPITQLTNNAIPYLRDRISRAQLILFAGAGFSVGAQNRIGDPVPLASALTEALWRVVFPEGPVHPSTTLQIAFEGALRKDRVATQRILCDKLAVDARSLPSHFKVLLDVPWRRIYTTNVDTLFNASNVQFRLRRAIRSYSASGPTPTDAFGEVAPRHVSAMHVNGTYDDIPDRIVFSVRQYGRQASMPHAAYERLSADLLNHAVVFIGTQIEEPSFWSTLEARSHRGGKGTRELRPRSFLVTPALDPMRALNLRDYNIEWLQGTAADFADLISTELNNASDSGHSWIASHYERANARVADIPEVSELATAAVQGTDFLSGQEPVWADIQSGRAVRRECDTKLWAVASEYLSAAIGGSPSTRVSPKLIVITGTAASGKSTSLMRLSLRASSDLGVRVAWIDKSMNLAPFAIKKAIVESPDPPRVLAIDDADIFGSELPAIMSSISGVGRGLLLVISLRSTKLKLLRSGPLDLMDTRYEMPMPDLSDFDIDEVIAALKNDNRLGILSGQTIDQQRKVFQRLAGRQLLVAMIEATSGREFKDKIAQEYGESVPDGRHAHGLIAVATSLRSPINMDDLLIASGNYDNSFSVAVEELVRGRILTKDNDGLFRTRHRRIAEVLVDRFQQDGTLSDYVIGLIWACASSVAEDTRRVSRSSRLLRQLISHDYLKDKVGVDAARSVYAQVEEVLSPDHHYWLQRGSLEVEIGNVNEAERFLNEARGRCPDDPLVRNEWAYLLFVKAQAAPGAAGAAAAVEEAIEILIELIDARGRIDPRPFHVLGLQGVLWSRKGIVSPEDRRMFLGRIEPQIAKGCRLHASSEELAQLSKQITKDLWSTHVGNGE